MLVGIDASRAIAGQRTGTENYSLGLIRALLERQRFDYRLYFRDAPPPELAELAGPGAEMRVMPAARLWTHTRLTSELMRHRPDTLLVPAHVLPLTHPPASVVTVHDLGFQHFPAAHTRRQRAYLESSTFWAARRAARLLADSEATRRDVVRRYDVAPERILVAYPAVDPAYTPDTPPDEAATLRSRYGLGERYILFVGTLQPRKNAGVLVEALARVPHDVTLVLVGRPGWGGEAERLKERVERLVLSERVRFLGHAPAADLPGLMRQAVALALPSLHEGFGMPLAEAMACGTPTLAANTSSLPEVVGDAGILLPPRDPEAWASAIARVAEDDALRGEMRAKGLGRARRFTWERAAIVAEAALVQAYAQSGR
ncbi:MAG: glycosyltransferase family 1 protein [Anaerolineae bacterium]